jgi:hypothetical protein
MREILFRGKRKHCDGTIGEWVYGSLSVMSGGGHAFIIDHSKDCIYEVAPDTVGQYTGLEDCKGMRIYEGDVLRAAGATGWKVIFDNGAFFADLVNMPIPPMVIELISQGEVKVVGNIHDRPVEG